MFLLGVLTPKYCLRVCLLCPKAFGVHLMRMLASLNVAPFTQLTVTSRPEDLEIGVTVRVLIPKEGSSFASGAPVVKVTDTGAEPWRP